MNCLYRSILKTFLNSAMGILKIKDRWDMSMCESFFSKGTLWFLSISGAIGNLAHAQENIVTVGFTDGNIFKVGLNGSYTPFARIPDDQLTGVTVIDQNNIAVTGFQNDTIYRVNLNGSHSPIAVLPNHPGLDGIAAINSDTFITVGI